MFGKMIEIEKEKTKPNRTCYLCGKPCWSKTCRECYYKGKYTTRYWAKKVR